MGAHSLSSRVSQGEWTLSTVLSVVNKVEGEGGGTGGLVRGKV